MNRFSSYRPFKEKAIYFTGSLKPLRVLYLDHDLIDKAILPR